MRTLILGATGGIGGALARALGGTGELWLAGRRREVLFPLAQEVGARALPLELGDELEVQALLEEVGPLDLLLYAVGGVVRRPLRETGRLEAEDLLLANLLGAFLVLKHARFAKGARAAFLGAYPAYVEVPGFSLYAASKRALEGLLNAARREFRKEGVHLTLVRLPVVATGLWTPLGGPPKGALPPEEAARRILEGLKAEPPPEVMEL